MYNCVEWRNIYTGVWVQVVKLSVFPDVLAISKHVFQACISNTSSGTQPIYVWANSLSISGSIIKPLVPWQSKGQGFEWLRRIRSPYMYKLALSRLPLTNVHVCQHSFADRLSYNIISFMSAVVLYNVPLSVYSN